MEKHFCSVEEPLEQHREVIKIFATQASRTHLLEEDKVEYLSGAAIWENGTKEL